MLVWHFSRLMRLMATFSFLGLQYAAWTTAVAPLPEEHNTNTPEWTPLTFEEVSFFLHDSS